MPHPFVLRFLILAKWSSSKHLEFGIKEFEQLTSCVIVDKSQDFPEPPLLHQKTAGSFPTCHCKFRFLGDASVIYSRHTEWPVLTLGTPAHAPGPCFSSVCGHHSQLPEPVLLFLKVSSGHQSPFDPFM